MSNRDCGSAVQSEVVGVALSPHQEACALRSYPPVVVRTYKQVLGKKMCICSTLIHGLIHEEIAVKA